MVRETAPDECLDRLAGLILGTAVGDALGLPREGLSRDRACRLFGPRPLRHSLFLGRGLTSDDTDHTCMVGQALLDAPEDVDRFARSLAWRLRLWLLGLPSGIGRATLRGILKLWLGFAPQRSGVFSAGNGPAMRAAVLGACLGNRPDQLRQYVRDSTRLTHTDPRAERGALLIAYAGHYALCHAPTPDAVRSFLPEARSFVRDLDGELTKILDQLDAHLQRAAPAVELADALGLQRGVTGYIYHTVPLALYCWLRSPGDFRQVVEEVIDLGGDADTTGAIAGALVGASVGANGIPSEWLVNLWEWPRSVAWMRRLAGRLARQFPQEGAPETSRPVPLFWPGVLPRNLLLLPLVLGHLFRRLLPPY